MARVTVEDCLENVENRFKLVMISTHRARQLARGSGERPAVGRNDKPTVMALREIAAGLVDASVLDEPVEALVRPTPSAQHEQLHRGVIHDGAQAPSSPSGHSRRSQGAPTTLRSPPMSLGRFRDPAGHLP